MALDLRIRVAHGCVMTSTNTRPPPPASLRLYRVAKFSHFDHSFRLISSARGGGAFFGDDKFYGERGWRSPRKKARDPVLLMLVSSPATLPRGRPLAPLVPAGVGLPSHGSNERCAAVWTTLASRVPNVCDNRTARDAECASSRAPPRVQKLSKSSVWGIVAQLELA